MENRKKIEEELKELESSLPGAGIPGPFSVPEGYFQDLAELILSRIRTEQLSAPAEIQSLSPLLASINRKMPYDLPSGYFEQIPDAPVKEDPRSAILELVERVTPYEVPYDYFDELPARIIRKVRPDASFISMRKNWMRVSVAAVLLGLILVTGFFFLDSQNNQPVTVAAAMQNVSNQELEDFLKNSTVVIAAEPVETASAAPEVKKLLNDVADKELEEFLSEIPSDDLYALN